MGDAILSSSPVSGMVITALGSSLFSFLTKDAGARVLFCYSFITYTVFLFVVLGLFEAWLFTGLY